MKDEPPRGNGAAISEGSDLGGLGVTIGRNALIAEYISPPNSPYYVYLLIDPQSRKPFYVGKGTRDRFRSHGEAALIEDDQLAPKEHREKLERIRSIRKRGSEPEVVFARVQISSEDEAFRLEAALIDTLDRYVARLVNVIRGQGTGSGLKTLEDLERELAAPEFTTLTPAILIKLFDWKAEVDPDLGRPGYGFRSDMTLAEMLESVRAWWVLDPKRAAKYRYAVAVHNGITRGVWEVKPNSLTPWTPRPGRKLRWSFSGSEAPPDVVDAFVGRVGCRVPRLRPDGRGLFGQANPIGYWPI
jgi:uncharacterized protein